ncbi:MAG: hypothetical protein AAB509_01260 [Patescibacteria group bacterium]
MVKFIAGIVLLSAPFLLVNLFKDKKSGFAYILLFSIIFQTLLAIFTQFFGIFYYGVILGANIVFVLVMFIPLGNKLFIRLSGTACPEACKKFIASLNKIDWIFFAVAIISVLTLYQVHYNYTGKFNRVNDDLFQYHEAKNMQYVYPYFSDEWYAISLVKESINNHSLPIKNPFDSSFFPNLEMFFHSFIAEIMLLLGLDPLTQYTVLSIFINTLIILLAYLLLRINNVSKFASAISSLSVLYITSASNLPGIWNLIPVTMGIALFLMGLCFLSLHRSSMQVSDTYNNYRCQTPITLTFLFAALLYPPLIIFCAIALLIYLKFARVSIVLFFSGAIILAALLVFPFAEASKYIFSNLFYRSFTGDFMPQFSFYYIIPWCIIILAIIGLPFVIKNKKWLFYQLIMGIIFWIFYTFSAYRIIIGYERVVFFTSILVALISGFGIEESKKYLSLKFEKIRPVFKYIEVGAIVLFFLFIPFYTQGENWRKLILTNNLIQADSIPKSPANNYLTDEDLRIFKNIKQKRFFSIPWKGTVIGIATNNYPIATKGGTITMNSKNPIAYQQFMEYDCDKKFQFAKERNVDYIYSSAFSCLNFQEIDKSSEGFVLYKFIWNK